jgi:hypothetical protein
MQLYNFQKDTPISQIWKSKSIMNIQRLFIAYVTDNASGYVER